MGQAGQVGQMGQLFFRQRHVHLRAKLLPSVQDFNIKKDMQRPTNDRQNTGKRQQKTEKDSRQTWSRGRAYIIMCSDQDRTTTP